MSGFSSTATRVSMSSRTPSSPSSSKAHSFFPMATVTAFVQRTSSATSRQRNKLSYGAPRCHAFFYSTYRKNYSYGNAAKSSTRQLWGSSALGGSRSRIEPSLSSPPNLHHLWVSPGGSIRRLSSISIPPPTSSSSSSTSLAASKSKSETSDEAVAAPSPSLPPSLGSSVREQYCKSRLLFLNEEMVKLTGGNKDFNANSPAQRSMAIFGEVRSCTKDMLREISGTSSFSDVAASSPYQSLSDDKRLLAEYILEFQDLVEMQKNLAAPIPRASSKVAKKPKTVDAEQTKGTKGQQQETLDIEVEAPPSTPPASSPPVQTEATTSATTTPKVSKPDAPKAAKKSKTVDSKQIKGTAVDAKDSKGTKGQQRENLDNPPPQTEATTSASKPQKVQKPDPPKVAKKSKAVDKKQNKGTTVDARDSKGTKGQQQEKLDSTPVQTEATTSTTKLPKVSKPDPPKAAKKSKALNEKQSKETTVEAKDSKGTTLDAKDSKGTKGQQREKIVVEVETPPTLGTPVQLEKATTGLVTPPQVPKPDPPKVAEISKAVDAKQSKGATVDIKESKGKKGQKQDELDIKVKELPAAGATTEAPKVPKPDSPKVAKKSKTADAKQSKGTKGQQLKKLDSKFEPEVPASAPAPAQKPPPPPEKATTVVVTPKQNPTLDPAVKTPPAVRTRSGGGVTEGRKRQPRQRPITYEEIVEEIFAKPRSSKIDSYWKEPLLELSRPVARDLAKQLDSELCPMGYDQDATAGGPNPTKRKTTGPTRGKRVGFLGYCRDQKELYPKHVILVRCGDFYETFGLDAMMLVEHVGLNPMGGKARSGCPKQNIQATLDGLTAQGFSVAVYEEIEPVGTSSTKKLKERSLAQIVSPASPTYLYDNWLLGSGGSGEAAGMNDASYSLDGLPPPRPCVGVVHTAAGYSIVEVSLEERSVQYSERLTAEAVACRLAAYPPADPLVYVPSRSEQENARPSFLPGAGSARGDTGSSSSGHHRLRTKILKPHLVPNPAPGTSDADRYINAIVDTILKMNELQPTATTTADNGNSNSDEENTDKAKFAASLSDFTVTMASTSTNPLYVETAAQIGLMDDKTIPSLIRHVLDDAAPAATRRFLHRYLLIPPPPSVALSMASVVGTLIDETNTISLPPLTVPNLGKSLILIRAGQAGAGVYGELLQSLDTTMYVLESSDDDDIGGSDSVGSETMETFVEALLHMCQYESGLSATRESLLKRCQSAVAAIEAVVSSSYHVEEDYENVASSLEDVVSTDGYVPMEFFERNERSWRGRVQQSVAEDAYERVRDAAQELSEAIRDDFIGTSDSNKALIKYNFFDNLVSLNKIPSEGFENEMTFVHPNDRFGKILSNRWTTEKVKKAVSRYVSECENATKEVASILSALAKDLEEKGHIPAIVQSSHFNLILSTAFHHAVKATNSKWQLANTIEDEEINDDDSSSSSTGGTHFVDVFPYWMHKSSAVTNTFDLSSMILLTAPNMSGKSTLMRSTAAAALLTVCGLCAPLSSDSKIPRFDTLFLRGASADVPTENKSAFGAEMGDLAALFRCSGNKSLVFVDELGRGTSPRDGTRLAGAVLERMAECGMSGIFATHLHDVLDLPLNKDRIVTKRIQIDRREGDDGGIDYEWTHKLEDGICKDSMALVTAERFGLPDEIIARARELTAFIPGNSSFPIAIHESDGVVPNNNNNNTTEKEDLGPPKPMLAQESINTTEVVDDVSTTAENKIPWKDLKREFQKEFHDVIGLASRLLSVGNDGDCDDDDDDSTTTTTNSNNTATMPTSIEIPPRHHPPASLANRSCLYVLQLNPEAPPASSATSATRYYVGETDSISKRLTQHRKKGGKWKAARAVVFPLGNKSKARYLESALIGELAREGYSLESIGDGRTLRHLRD